MSARCGCGTFIAQAITPGEHLHSFILVSLHFLAGNPYDSLFRSLAMRCDDFVASHSR